MTRTRSPPGSPPWRTAWPATATTSRMRSPRVPRRWSGSTSPRTRGISWAPATTVCCCTCRTTPRGCGRPGPGIRCLGTSRRRTRWPVETPSTRSGDRSATATAAGGSSGSRCCTSSLCGSPDMDGPAAVVIGAGPNGLAAAIRLARAGRPVTVLEAADTPGGAVRTEALTLPGFHHDTFSSVYPAGAASPVFAAMPLARFGLEWVHPEACSAHPLPGGRAIALYRDPGRTAASLNGVRAGDGDAWLAFVEPLLDAWDAVRATMLSGFPPLAGPIKLLRAAGPVELARFAALLPGSAQGLGRRLFQSPDARAWLYGAAGHGDVAPSGRGSAIAAAYLNLLGHAVGWPSPRGGAQRLTDALVGYLGELGGRVRTGAPATAVHGSGGRVTGVSLADGETIAAGTVIADVMPHALDAMAGEHLPGVYRRLLRRYRYGQATVKVDWALDGPIPWTAQEVRG